jgi:surface antigen
MKPELEGGLERRGLPMPGNATLLLAVLAATLCLISAQFAGSARADTFELCGGYTACAVTPYTTHGYENAADQSWWSMYPGVNCTNYAAFVESQVYGVPTPGVLMGDAYQWAERATEVGIPVDNTPTVGSVAVWGADSPGMGGYGHVAVVESVGPGYIDVSQSGMGTQEDGYDWERIARAGGSWEPWPTSFIHFAGPGVPGTVPQAGHRIRGAELTMAGA